MDIAANVPNADFDFSIAKYDSTKDEKAVISPAADGNHAVINGVTALASGTLDFKADDAATTCISQDVDQPDQLVVPDGASSVEQTFYLHHGQKITVRGLAKGFKYTVTEAPEDYAVTASAADGADKNTGDAETEGSAITLNSDHAMIDDCIKGDAVIDFTNDRSGGFAYH